MHIRSLGVKGKIMAIVAMIVLVAIGATVGPILYLQTEKMYQSYQNEALSSSRAMEEMFSESERKTKAVANLAALLPGLAEAAYAGDGPKLLQLIQDVPKSGVDYVTVTDKNGVVLARTHSSKTGDSIANIYAVQQAMIGNTSTTVENSPATPLSIRTCLPIRLPGGQVVGTLSVSIDGAQQTLVDKVKEIYQVDATVFGGDTRVSTTVMKDGQRAIGTKASGAVIAKVLQEKAIYTGVADVNGKPYVTAYRPILGAQDGTVGMLFAGKSLEQYYADRNHQIFVTVIAALAVLVLCLGLSYWLTKIFCVPLEKLTVAVKAFSQGNLSVTVDHVATDEFGTLAQGFNNMGTELRKLVGMVNSQAEQLAASSEELTAGTEQSALASQQVATSITQVAEGAAMQLAAVEESVQSIRQMSDLVQHAAEQMEQVAAEAAETSAKATQGDAMVKQAVSQMDHIKSAVGTSAELVTVLGSRSQEIGQIIDTISGIAGQTNLLALNAAIEAARAGEQGRGFAVVAEEVRKLAEQSQAAAQKITELINEIQRDTEQTVQAMHNGTKEVGNGAKIVMAAGNAFQEIERRISRINSSVGTLSVSMQEINQSNKAVVGNIDKIDSLSKAAAAEAETVSAATEEQSASMEEMAASSRGLADMAQNLITAVGKFSI
ncbi:methyl-accepting chemotaxis protein [Propionispora hippei]|uniref:Single cache domain 3-containing protein n=1 Tax=Propionispora hippei DSM 15287 TaxID=1123003 RepID=A0A1M6IFM4_9FIRM|nr:methyl-accepting chemotaxis protein [Propionispora hippei]SHJ33249.1 Single cache domain 3-containing protein [Propionispora hippei DSM 15287]